MANLYDKIRKKKKENLEKIYKDLSAPKSMAESVAKFKSIDSSAAYGGGKAAANIQAAIGEGAKAKETGGAAGKEDPACIDVDGQMMLASDTTKPCPPKKSAGDILGDLFGKGKGGDGGNGDNGGSGIEKRANMRASFLKEIVGDEGVLKIINASPFKENGDNGDDDIDISNLEDDEGAGTSDGMGVSDSSVVIGGQAFDVSGEQGEAGDEIDANPDKKKNYTGMDDACSEEYIAAKGPGDCDRYKKSKSRCEKWFEENPGYTPEEAAAVKCGGHANTYEENPCPDDTYTFNEATKKCEKIGGDDKVDIEGRTIEGKDPESSSENVDFIQSWFAAGGQKNQQGQAERQEKRDFKEDFRSLDRNQKDLFNETKKYLRKQGKLPRGKANVMEAVFNAMNDYEKMKFTEGGGVEEDFVASGDYGKNTRLTTIGRGIRDGSISYKDIERAGEYDGRKLSDEELEKLRNISDDYLNNDRYQKEDSYKSVDPGDGTEKRFETKKEFDDWLTTDEGKEWLQNNPDFKSSSPKNYVTKNQPSMAKKYVSEAQRKAVWASKKDGGKGNPNKKLKTTGFKMKRGTLGRPGY